MRNLCRLGLALGLASCAAIDRGAMTVSDAVSSRDPVTGAREINLESESAELERAQSQSKQILDAAKNEKLKIDGQLPQFSRVKGVFERLRRVAHRRGLPWEVHLIESKDWNAFTLGGGKLFLFSGILEGPTALQSDDEIAAVLAHEMAHVSARHASEGQAKQLLFGLVDSANSSPTFSASFSTNQEDEADRYSVVYSALAGFDPRAAVGVWKRMDQAAGSDPGDLLYDHPLSRQRALNLEAYSAKAMKYYSAGRENPDHDALLKSNAVFSLNEGSKRKAGEGGGVLALLETAGNAYAEVLNARREENERLATRRDEESLAARSLGFRDIHLQQSAQGRLISGQAVNLSGSHLKNIQVSLKYLLKTGLVHEERFALPSFAPGEAKNIERPLKNLRFDAVDISPAYLQVSAQP